MNSSFIKSFVFTVAQLFARHFGRMNGKKSHGNAILATPVRKQNFEDLLSRLALESLRVPVPIRGGERQIHADLLVRSKTGAWISAEDVIGENEMPLVTVVLTLGVVGVLLWLVNRFIPMQSQIKSILNAVVVIVVVLWLLRVFGLLDYLLQFRVGH